MTSPLNNLSILTLDDNAHMALIVKTILRGFGIVHVHEAHDVAEALAIATQFPIDIAIVDQQLGFMDGVAFVRLMRTAADSSNPFVPIIMLTAHTEQYRVEEARDAGVTEFCAKPVVPADLYRKMVQIISHPRNFVRADRYFGPDRRRRRDDLPGDERRRDALVLDEPKTGGIRT